MTQLHAQPFGLAESDLLDRPLWVDTGSEQLVLPLATFDAVRRAKPRPDAMEVHASNGQRSMAYVFAREGDRVLARFFFPKHGAMLEDPGTGSACANLGGWFTVVRPQTHVKRVVSQGEAVARPSTLYLDVTHGAIHVGGDVVELGRGSVRL